MTFDQNRCEKKADMKEAGISARIREIQEEIVGLSHLVLSLIPNHFHTIGRQRFTFSIKNNPINEKEAIDKDGPINTCYPNSLGINPLTENDGPPTSRDRAAKMLRIWNINNVAKYGISTLLINAKEIEEVQVETKEDLEQHQTQEETQG
ncbi:10919_t:CDS:2 [Rhizophagus irregularis]|nr:10919_t:CDS:2 [Rhizophagus irregularis]